ncbi:MAG: hypothetical protein HKO92_00575, partial [Flavobacteriaceae bacterium]|nr:hypothetical protein [Flavobacteriaceae bacterium]
DIIKLFRKSEIENFSESDIEGFKSSKSSQVLSNWFASERSGTDSELFFSFAEDEKVDVLFENIKTYNKALETNNPIRAIVVPVEKYI